MAAALKLDPPPTDSDDDLDIVPGSMRTWRTKEGTVLGITARFPNGEWVALADGSDDLTVHETLEDASLRLTLAYMRRFR